MRKGPEVDLKAGVLRTPKKQLQEEGGNIPMVIRRKRGETEGKKPRKESKTRHDKLQVESSGLKAWNGRKALKNCSLPLHSTD